MSKFSAVLYSFKQSWGNIIKQPLEHLINILILSLIVGICLASVTISNNLHNWQNKMINYPQLMVYLDNSANEADIDSLQHFLANLPRHVLKNYHFVSKAEGLASLQQDQQLKSIVSNFSDKQNNPLPDMFILNSATTESATLNKLSQQLNQIPMVDKVSVDLAYANKLNSLINFTSNLVIGCCMLCFALLSLVIYNMIRLQMLINHDQIMVSRLIGASDSFIMRPLFCYAIWQISLALIIASLALHGLISYTDGLLININDLFIKGLQITSLDLPSIGLCWLSFIIFTLFTVFMAVRWIFSNIHAR
ncbi:MAG: hypothetical protein RLZZ293_48 [Pseudomonadota bacterium]|jgi:cell division transport system permease protein